MVVELSQLSVVTNGKCECPLFVVCVIGQKQPQTTSDLSVHHVTTVTYIKMVYSIKLKKLKYSSFLATGDRVYTFYDLIINLIVDT